MMLEELAKLESITQRTGEKVVPYLNRIKLAAASVKMMKFGTCSRKTHPDLNLEECIKGPNEEPATNLNWPCAKGAVWETLKRRSLEGATLHEIGILIDSHEECPPCCRKVRDSYFEDWLIKKQFLDNMHDKKMRMQLDLALLGDHWMSLGMKEKFNPMSFNMASIIFFAKQNEQGFRFQGVAVDLTTQLVAKMDLKGKTNNS